MRDHRLAFRLGTDDASPTFSFLSFPPTYTSLLILTTSRSFSRVIVHRLPPTIFSHRLSPDYSSPRVLRESYCLYVVTTTLSFPVSGTFVGLLLYSSFMYQCIYRLFTEHIDQDAWVALAVSGLLQTSNVSPCLPLPVVPSSKNLVASSDSYRRLPSPRNSRPPREAIDAIMLPAGTLPRHFRIVDPHLESAHS